MQQLSEGPYIIPVFHYIAYMIIQLLGMVKNPETRAPSIITKWVETKDFRV